MDPLRNFVEFEVMFFRYLHSGPNFNSGYKGLFYPFQIMLPYALGKFQYYRVLLFAFAAHVFRVSEFIRCFIGGLVT